MKVTPEEFISEKISDDEYSDTYYPTSRQEVSQWIKEFIDISETNGDIEITTNKPNTKSNLPIQIVNEPLEVLKKLLAEKNIELITKALRDRERRFLIYEIEIAIKSIEAIK